MRGGKGSCSTYMVTIAASSSSRGPVEAIRLILSVVLSSDVLLRGSEKIGVERVLKGKDNFVDLGVVSKRR